MHKTAVVILNWNGRKHLEKYLPSVVQYSQNADIIVADNASTDDSVDYVSKNYPQIKIIQTGSNLGYAGGYNVALEMINNPYSILLNSDVAVEENWIFALEKCMDDDPSVAACQPLILQDNKRDHFEYAGAAGGFIDQFGYPFCRGRIFDSMEKNEDQYSDADIFWAGGACIMVRTEVFKALGGFETEFFAHMEEIDLCWRMLNKGHKVKCAGNSRVYHLGGGTLHKSSPRKTYLNFRNSLLTLLRNHPQNGVIKAVLIRLMLDGIAAARFLLSGKFGHFWAILRSHIYFYTHLKRWTKDRHALLSEFPAGVYLGSIVADHFLKGKKKFTELDGKFSK